MDVNRKEIENLIIEKMKESGIVPEIANAVEEYIRVGKIAENITVTPSTVNWIPYNGKYDWPKPKDGQECLTCINVYGGITNRRICTDIANRTYHNGVGFDVGDAFICAWAPLPEPYIEGSKDRLLEKLMSGDLTEED